MRSGAAGRRILVVDDEWLIADAVADELKQAGYEVAGPTGSVAGALRLIASGIVDAALLDVHLHHEDSFGIADELARRATPFAFVSGFSREQIPDAYRHRPLLSKPIADGQLQAVLAALLADA